eukprot:GHVT01013004.1.p2 GENE.GHVT01013004.1~~GHVT01013004.1.p2  ORF type:complete len:126 (+),score=16.25 GHVT01013004.1:932-1309(+)
MVVLRDETLSYAKAIAAVPSGWAQISLRQVVQITTWPDDSRVFLLQTQNRAFHLRAPSSREREEWVLRIASQCALLREFDLLKHADEKIVQGENRRALKDVSLSRRCTASVRWISSASHPPLAFD